MKNPSTKRILTALLALMLVLAVFPVPASAEALCPCCNQPIDNITWSTMPTITKVLKTGHYRVTKNINRENPYTISGTVTVDLAGFTITAPENGRAFRLYENTLNLFDSVGTGAVYGNGTVADTGGVVYVPNGGTFNLYSGTITNGCVSGEYSGGNIRVSGTMNMYGGVVTNGFSNYHGGNISVSYGEFNMYGGYVTDGIAAGGSATADGRGGNIYATGNNAGVVKIYGGTITGGASGKNSGKNIYAVSGAAIKIFGGTVASEPGSGTDIYLSASGGNFATMEIYGGTVGVVDQVSAKSTITVYNGTLSTNPRNFLAGCACYYQDGEVYKVWNSGYADRTCDETCPFTQNAQYVKSFLTGSHSYIPTREENTYGCGICNHSIRAEGAVALTDTGVYTTLADAVATGKDVWLLADTSTGDIALNGNTLDLNGHDLTAGAVTATAGHIIDSTGGLGSLDSTSLALAADNKHLPLQTQDKLRFSAMTPDVTLERMSQDTVRVRFVFTEKAAETIIDDLIKAGNSDLSLEITLSWKNGSKTATKTYICDPALLVKYAQKWDGRRYVVTISGVEDVQDLTCTVQILSGAAFGVKTTAPTLKNVAYINKKLSWEDINSYPLKTEDVTVAQMRQYCVDFFEYSKTFLWTPDASVDFVRNDNGSFDSMSQGTVYGGMPYVGSASGSPYRMMDYVNQETGLVDMQKALPSLAAGKRIALEDMLYFGSQCAKTAALGWARFINSANIRATLYMTPANGVILLGDIQISNTAKNWGPNNKTTTACQENGEEVMYEAYAQLQKADGLVQYTTAGHVVMAYSDAVVVRDENGAIDGEQSYVMIIHQAQKWTDQENEYGDRYQMKASINSKMTFAGLYSGGYIPYTFKEFLGTDPVETTTLSITSGGETLLSGTIRESDRVFQAETTVESLTLNQLYKATVSSNYGISDVYIVIYNTRGQEIYRHAVRSESITVPTLAMAQTGAQVTVWEYDQLVAGKTYTAEIVVQMATGERPTVYRGQLTIDN